ncbi:MAG: TMEM175 family protein [Burkholderiaceae bacterium]|jgi:uncharacterized membrane protein
MGKNRLEMFSDGVIAIIITIMVLELKGPGQFDFASLQPLIPKLLSYLLSFVTVAIFWSNHHHLLHAVHHVNGAILWANMHWLFWLSLIPAVTAWMGEHQFHRVPVATYGCVVLMTGIAYRVLVRVLVASQGDDSELARTTRNDMKSRLSFAAYLLAIPLAFVAEWLTIVIFFAVSVAWLLPDKRLELIAKE